MIVKLKPALKSYLWGGTALKTDWGKIADEETVSEAWELSFHPAGLSVVESGEHLGKSLAEVTEKKDLGDACDCFPFFPVLVKLIDAKLDLSVQVHPSDDYALKNEGQYGKTEMWYILDAEPGARLYLGFNRDMTKEKVREAIAKGTLCESLNAVPVKAGETYFIESGTVHAIGAGITLAEIQQNSSLTYRVYDFNRRDKNGNLRELHIEKALEVLSYDRYEVPSPKRKTHLLGRCPYFSASLFSGNRVIQNEHSFTSVTALEKPISVESLTLSKGETAFISAGEKAEVRGEGSFLSVEVPFSQ